MSDIKDIEKLSKEGVDLAAELDNIKDDEGVEGEEVVEEEEIPEVTPEDPKEGEEGEDLDPKPTDPQEGKDTSIFESDDNPYKKKAEQLSERYSDSSRENALNQKIIKAYKDQAIIPDENTEITDEIISKRFPDQDVENMTFMEKEMAKKMIKDEVREKVGVKKAAEAQFNEDLNKAYTDPVIKENKEEFLNFLESKIIPGVYPDVETLAQSFAYRMSKNPSNVKKVQGKSALEGTGYGASKSKPLAPGKKISGSEATALQKANPQKFNDMLIKGQIDMIGGVDVDQ